ncbi:MAG: hypothetical protein JRF54_00530, partial [Deltaproteobacteria bacterium]|nr:hypothetical protein [Deltaproteobacteria bacterium]
TFRILYVFLVLEHERRRIVHFNVTDGPSAQWTGQQLVNAFPDDSEPRSRSHTTSGVSCAHCAGLRRMPQNDSRVSSRW